MFLVLTALEEFWDTSQPMLFLGEWCKKYERKAVWEKLTASVLQSDKLQYANSYEAYQYASSTYEKLLPKIAEWLNELHHTQHSLSYWRLLVGPFLFWYTQVVYQRFLYLAAAYHEYPNLETHGLSHHTFMTPMSTNEFVCFASYHDTWNLQLFTQILDLYFKKPTCYKKIIWKTELEVRNGHFYEGSYKWRTKFFINILRILNKFKGMQNIGILNGFFSTRDLFKLMLGSGFRILPLLPTKPINRGQNLSRSILSPNSIDMKKRKMLLNITVEDELSKLIINTLPVNMPFNFVEGYQHEVEASKKYFPYVSKVILQEQVASYDQYKFWIGEQLELGAKVMGYQHGGCYGMQKASSAEFLERHVSHFFISWGWSDKNVLPAPMSHDYRLFEKYSRKEKNEKAKDILWVATLYVRYSIAIYDWPITGRPYLNYQKRFFDNVENKIATDICMRLNPSFENLEEVKMFIPGLNVYSPKNRESFFTHLDSTKIVVIDNPSTTFLYALALNIPTILFWDKEHWVFRDEAKPYLEMLERVGIYYETPEAAAQMLNKIADDPYPWWNSEAVQSVRQQFCDNFARIAPRYLREWTDLLLGVNQHKNIETIAMVSS